MKYEALVSPHDVQELVLLLRAHHPLLRIETRDGELAQATLRAAAQELGVPVLEWVLGVGFVRRQETTTPRASIELEPFRPPGQGAGGVHNAVILKEGKLLDALSFIEESTSEALYLFPALGDDTHEPRVKEALRRIAKQLFENASAVVFLAPTLELPADLEHLVTEFVLAPLAADRYRAFLQEVLRDVRRTTRIEVDVTPDDLARLLRAAQGLSLEELRRIISVPMVRDGKLSIEDLYAIEQAKHALLLRTGCLESAQAEVVEGDVAGLDSLKTWLRERRVAFAEPERAAKYGLKQPRGLLLMGVQGCGKSLSAKLCASVFRVPLVRFDPASLFHKYVGETEKTLKRTLKLAETMAPLVLWIDELDKAFGSSDASDGGLSRRVLGTFLSWLAEHKAHVFVVATANDVETLPPELLRKGRFDEMFFVDLPTAEVRRALFEIHLKKAGREPAAFALDDVLDVTEGFSGGEIEQLVSAAMFLAFSEDRELRTEDLIEKAVGTVPLSTTMAEGLQRLRHWCEGRAVPAL